MSARERTLVANGLRHHMVEWGTPGARPTVILCHGFLDIAWGYRDLAERLAAAGYHAVAFDWRGHGESDWIGAGGYYHFPDYVLDLHGLLPQLTSAPCHLVGHSMGGTVCCMFAATHAEQLRTLTLLEGLGPPASPPATYPERLRSWLAAVDRVRGGTRVKLPDAEAALARLRRRTPELPEGLGRLIAEKSTEPHPDADGTLSWRFDPLHRTPSAFGFDIERFMDCLHAIRTPTLCIRGSRGMRTGDDAERLQALTEARDVEVSHAGHMLQWTAAPACADEMLKFWGKT